MQKVRYSGGKNVVASVLSKIVLIIIFFLNIKRHQANKILVTYFLRKKEILNSIHHN